jgi:enoyl-CoA hydratase/carnithine racemase
VSNPAQSLDDEAVLLRDTRGSVVTLTLNRPKSYNALNEALLEALEAALDDIEQDHSIRVVVVAANGKAFCTGHDFKEMQSNRSEIYYRRLFSRSSELMMRLMRLPQPVIARVHATATANGCNLVASCDLAVASADARFAVSGVDYGLFCSTPSVGLSRNVSRKRAFELLVTGGFIDAETAKDYGLVNRVVPAERLDAEVAELAAVICTKSRVAIATGKRMFYTQIEKEILSAYDFANGVMASNMMTEDAEEGVNAFIQKRPPEWKDR